MAFELKRAHGVGREIRRLLDRQLTMAIEHLGGAAPDVQGARRHIKKARAVLLLAWPALAGAQKSLARRLHKASHLLGPLTDSEAVITTLSRLRGFDLRRLPDGSIASLRVALVSDGARVASGLESAWLRGRVIHILKRERAALADVRFERCGVHTTATAVRHAHRAARHARQAAADNGNADSLHAWRRRIKAEWFVLRLLDNVTHGKLIDDVRRLERLDHCLGELHDVVVLQAHVAAQSPLSRSQTAAALLATRAYARDLRRRAGVLADAQDEPPRDLETRVLALWLSGAAQAAPTRVASWPRRA